jgi:hypothetical protein
MSRETPACNDNEVLNIAAGHMRAAQAKWSRLNPHDLAGARDKHALIAVIEERYSLPHGVAAQDVELWLRDTFQGRR